MTAPWSVARQTVGNGRGTVWLLIDAKHQRGAIAEPEVVAKFDHPHEALAMAAVLNGADAVYRAELAAAANREAF